MQLKATSICPCKNARTQMHLKSGSRLRSWSFLQYDRRSIFPPSTTLFSLFSHRGGFSWDIAKPQAAPICAHLTLPFVSWWHVACFHSWHAHAYSTCAYNTFVCSIAFGILNELVGGFSERIANSLDVLDLLPQCLSISYTVPGGIGILQGNLLCKAVGSGKKERNNCVCIYVWTRWPGGYGLRL